MSLSGPETSFVSACQPKASVGSVGAEMLERYESLVQQFFRLLKSVQLHSMDNQSVQQNIKQCVSDVQNITQILERDAVVSFIGDGIYVCGSLLQAQRAAYESAFELAKVMRGAGIWEIRFSKGLSEDDLDTFCRAFIINVVKEREGFLLRTQFSNLNVLGYQDSAAGVSLDGHSALVLFAEGASTLQLNLEHVAGSASFQVVGLKGLAQSLVDLALSDPLSLKILLNWERDDCREGATIFQAAALSVLLASNVCEDRDQLCQFALASLSYGLGLFMEPKAEESSEGSVLVALGLAFGGVSESSIRRMSTLHGASEMTAFGPNANLRAELLALSFRYIKALRGAGDGGKSSHLDVLHTLAQTDGFQQSILKLLVQALGFFPPGTILELDSRSWALVTGEASSDLARPVVRIIADSSGVRVEGSGRVDLSKGANQNLLITAVVNPRHCQFNYAALLHS